MDAAQFLNDVDEDFLCTICQDVMVNPHFCREGHQFCLECITNWLQRSKTCPSDRKELVEGNLTKNPMARNLISKLVVRCLNAAAGAVGAVDGYDGGGCEWSGALSERERHLRDHCGFVEVRCGSAGCDVKVQRARLADHEAICELREVSCESCPAKFTARESDQHQLTCKGVEIGCPMRCGKMVRRGDMAQHEKECEELVVCCPFASHGCQVRGKKRKISEHEEEATAIHLQLATSTTKRQREESSRLEKALAESTKQVTEHAQQVLALQKQLKECQSEHAKQIEKLEAAHIGEGKVAWKIEDFTNKLKQKRSIDSKPFHVDTKAGRCHLGLKMVFYRKAGSETQGFVVFGVCHLMDQGGLLHFPIKLAGTRFEVQSVVGGSTYEIFLGEQAELQFPRARCSIWAGFRTEMVDGVTWSDGDSELPEILARECDRDATDYLERNTMTVRATLRVTPPEELWV
mmetsp:Transcript_48307/g.98651  ORF Transcript_48307/g.98651 Transcript_48307/m.98651 type:complete len:462 (-) Transcript_48307:243-1628(-)